MSSFELVIREATRILNDRKAVSRESSVPGPVLVDELEKLEEINLKRGSLFSYVSSGANDPSLSNIVSGGTRSGYWLSDFKSFEPSVEKEEVVEISVGKRKKEYSEKSLYPLVELWLSTKGLRAKDTSTAKSGGKWGNPDIIGLNRIQAFGISDIEIASCEVKINTSNWEQFIFEAISHKRFSDRSYFCVRHDGSSDVPKSILYYAEKFRIGVVLIELSDNDLIEIESIGNDFKRLEPYLDRVSEIFPALFDAVSAQEKVLLLERLGIRDERTFYAFGREY
jgi:hypothetical protein